MILCLHPAHRGDSTHGEQESQSPLAATDALPSSKGPMRSENSCVAEEKKDAVSLSLNFLDSSIETGLHIPGDGAVPFSFLSLNGNPE